METEGHLHVANVPQKVEEVEIVFERDADFLLKLTKVKRIIINKGKANNK